MAPPGTWAAPALHGPLPGLGIPRSSLATGQSCATPLGMVEAALPPADGTMMGSGLWSCSSPETSA